MNRFEALVLTNYSPVILVKIVLCDAQSNFSYEKILFAFLLQVLKRNESLSSKAGDPPSSAILVVYLDKAEALPVSHLTLPSVPMFRA